MQKILQSKTLYEIAAPIGVGIALFLLVMACAVPHSQAAVVVL